MGGDKQGAFESVYEPIRDGAFPLCNFFCVENLLSGQVCNPMCLSTSKVCCLSSGVSSSAECAGEKGVLFGVQKTCCCVEAVDSNNCSIGCCDMWLMGKPYGEDSNVKDEEMAFMESVHWCAYCLICGFGCTPPAPLAYTDAKVCCIELKGTSGDDCWDNEMGIINWNTKACCCMQAVQFPPTANIGCALCGVRMCHKDASESSD